MEQIFKEKDIVYTSYGYCTIVSCGNKNQIVINKKEPEVKQDQSPEKNKKTEQEEQIKIQEMIQKQQEERKEREINTSIVNILTLKQIIKGSTSDVLIYIPESELGKSIKKRITLHIKTFFGSRKKYELEFDIGTNVDVIKSRVIESTELNSKSFSNLRLVYPMGLIQELSQNLTIEQYQIQHQAQLILLVQTIFFWDPDFKGPGVKLSNSNLTAAKNEEQDFQNVLGNLAISSGRHYWEIKIDAFTEDESILLGVVKKDFQVAQQPYDSQMFWGYLPIAQQKCCGDGQFQEYGFKCKKNDSIGTLLEFKGGIGSLSFFKNGTKCGVAYNNLQGTFYPAACLYYGEVQLSLDPKAQIPNI